MNLNLEYTRLSDVHNSVQIASFIKTEIEPYLSISLEKKLTTSSIEEYAEKLIRLADGYIVSYDGEICGIVAAYIRNRVENDRIYLTLLGVAEGVRRHGIGGALLKKIILDLPDQCFVYTHVDEKNISAWTAYQKAGFQSNYVKNGRREISFMKG